MLHFCLLNQLLLSVFQPHPSLFCCDSPLTSSSADSLFSSSITSSLFHSCLKTYYLFHKSFPLCFPFLPHCKFIVYLREQVGESMCFFVLLVLLILCTKLRIWYNCVQFFIDVSCMVVETETDSLVLLNVQKNFTPCSLQIIFCHNLQCFSIIAVQHILTYCHVICCS